MTNSPDQTGRDHAGRFAPGCQPGPGRPAGSKTLDFRAIVTAKAAAEGLSLDDAVWQVANALLSAAIGGDVHASRVLLDRLCGRDALPVVVDEGPAREAHDPAPGARAALRLETDELVGLLVARPGQ